MKSIQHSITIPVDEEREYLIKNEWIKLEDMTEGWYFCKGRNFKYGYWNGKEFQYIRHKCTSQYEASELHWDSCKSFGTVKPFKKVSP